MFLAQARQCIEMTGALMTGKLGPLSLRLAGSGNGCIDVLGGTDGELGKLRAGRRFIGGKGLGRRRGTQFAIDEMAEGGVMTLQPGAGFGVGFRCRTIGHFVEKLCNRHDGISQHFRRDQTGSPCENALKQD